jgi:hypothetical protein
LNANILRPKLLILVVKGIKADGEVDAARREHIVNTEVDLAASVTKRHEPRRGSIAQYHGGLGMAHALNQARISGDNVT